MAETARPSLAHRRRRLALLGVAALALLLAAIGATLVADRRAAAVRETPLAADAPDRIVIRRDGFADVALVRDAGAGTDSDGAPDAWRIEAPCSLTASGARVAPLLEALDATRLTRDAAEVDLPGARLEPPVATLDVDGREVDVGGPDLGGARRYVRAGDRVGFAPEWLGSLIGGGMTAFAEPRVVDGTVVAVDGDAALADAWSALEAVQTVEWPVAGAPEIVGERRVTLELDGGREVGLDVASTEAWHAIRTAGARCARIVGVDELPG